jgi:hypothetical protein
MASSSSDDLEDALAGRPGFFAEGLPLAFTGFSALAGFSDLAGFCAFASFSDLVDVSDLTGFSALAALLDELVEPGLASLTTFALAPDRSFAMADCRALSPVPPVPSEASDFTTAFDDPDFAAAVDLAVGFAGALAADFGAAFVADLVAGLAA